MREHPRNPVVSEGLIRVLAAAFAAWVVVVVDQATKALAFRASVGASLPPRNPGLILGVGASSTPLIVLLSATVLLVFCTVIARWTVDIGVSPAIPAIVVGGMLSNAVDRVRGGSVRDFIHTPWLIFNLADVAIAGGIVVLGVAVALRLHRLRRDGRAV